MLPEERVGLEENSPPPSFSVVPAPGEHAVPRPSPQPYVPPHLSQAVTSRPRVSSLLRYNNWALLVTGGALLLIVSFGLITLFLAGFRANNQDTNAPSSQYTPKNLSVSDVPTSQVLQVSQADKLDINGQLKVNSTIVVTPTSAPAKPTTGQIYYDKATNKLFYFNGSKFVSVASGKTVSSLGNATGAITTSQEFQLNGNQLSLSSNVTRQLGDKVTSLQGQTGDVQLTAGSGIVVSGTTISNSGVISIVGTNGLQVAQTGGAVTVSLPQALGTTSSPTFKAVQLTNALGIGYGGTGLNTANLAAAPNAVLITDQNGTSYELAKATSGGQCLISDSTDNDKIKFGSCTGSTGVGVNKITANGVDVDTDVTLNAVSGSPITVTGNSGTDAITLGFSYNSTNLRVTAGVLNTIQDISTTSNVTFKNITSGAGGKFTGDGSGLTAVDAAKLNGLAASVYTQAGNSFNGASQLVQLNSSGQLPALNGSLLTAVDADKLDNHDSTYFLNAANLTGELADAVLSDNVTLQGNSFNGNGQLVKLDSNGKAATDNLCLLSTNNGAGTKFDNCAAAAGVPAAYVSGIVPAGDSPAAALSGQLTFAGAGGLTVTSSGQTITFTQGSNTCPTCAAANDVVNSIIGSKSGSTAVQGALTFNNASSTGTAITIDDAAYTTKGIASFSSSDFTVASGAVSLNTIGVAKGGTGLTSGPTAGGQLLIGKADGSYALSTLTAGSNVTITNANGSITIAATSSNTCPTCAAANDVVNSIIGSKSGSTAVQGALTFNNASSTGTAITIDDAAYTTKGIASFSSSDFTVASGAVSLNTIGVAKGGTGLTSGPTAGGQLLIGKADGSYALSTLTAGSNVTITNANGSITIAATTATGGNVSYGTTTGDGNGTAYTAGTITKSRLATIDAAGQLNYSELGFGTGYLQYTGSAYALDLKNATASTLTVKNSTAGQVANLSVTGTGSFTGALSTSSTLTTNGAISTTNNNINAGTGTVSAANLNATTAIKLNNNDINTKGTLSNVAYLDQNNVFASSATTQNAMTLNANSLTTGNGLKVATTSGSVTDGNLVDISQNSAYGSTFTSNSKLLNVSRNVTGPLSEGTIILDSTSGGAGFGSSASWSHTVHSGSNRALVVAAGIRTNSNSQVNSVTYAGIPLTKVNSYTDNSSSYASLWILLNPPVGTATVSMNGSGGAGSAGGASSSWFNVAGASQPTNGPGGYSASSAKQVFIDGIAYYSTSSTSPNAGQSLISYQVYSTYYQFGSSYKTAATPPAVTNIGWGGSDAYSVVVLNPAGVPGTTDGTLAGSVANISSSCLGCSETGNILNLQQANSSATGAVLNLQNGGTGPSIAIQSTGTGSYDLQLSSGIIRNASNSTAAVSIQNSSGTETLFKADTTNNRVVIGNATGNGNATTTLVLDSGTAATAPTGVAGAMYYDTTSNSFQCFTTSWGACGATGGNVSYGTTTGDGNGTAYTAGTITKSRLATIDAAGQLNYSELGFGTGYLQYTGSAYALDLKNATASTLTVKNSTAGQVANLSVTGTGSFTGALSTSSTLTTNGAISTTNNNINAGTGTVSAANLNATTAIKLNNNDINTKGTLSNVAYLDGNNAFTGNNTFKTNTNSTTGFRVQNASATDVFTVDTTNKSINVGAATTFTETDYTQGNEFLASAQYTSPGSNEDVATADLDGDGDKDVVTLNFAGASATVLKNNGDGTFASYASYTTGTSPKYVTLADIDGDGDKDMVVANFGSPGSVSVLKNNGNATFAAKVDYTTAGYIWSVTLADLDGDGDKDMIYQDLSNNGVYVRINNGTGTFGSESSLISTAASPMTVATADLDGDGDQDLIVSGYNGALSIRKNNGNATFAAKVDYTTGSGSRSVTTADLDGDGDQDIVTSNSTSNTVSVLINNGTGAFATNVDYPTNSNPYDVAIADYDNDGDLDLAVTGSGSAVSEFKNNGNGTFATKVDYTIAWPAHGIATADLDGDADADLVTANTTTNVSVLINDYLHTNTNIVSATASVTAASNNMSAMTIQGASSQLVDILRVQGADSSTYLAVASSGNVGIGAISNLASSSYALNVQGGGSIAGNFIIKNSSGTETLFKADTTNNRVVIGNATGNGNATTTLVLDSGTAATAPTGVAGAMYYDTTSNAFMCYTTTWGVCGATGGSGLTTVSANDGRIAKFTNSGTQMTNSNLAEDNTTLTYSGNVVINAASGYGGNLITLQVAGGNQLSVSAVGDITGGKFNTANISGGTLSDVAVNGLGVSNQTITGDNGLTIGASASGNYNLTLQGSGTGVVQVSSNLNVLGTTLTLGTVSTQGLLVLHAGNSFTGTIQIATALGHNTVYVLPAVSGSIVEICTSAGNCVPNGNTAGDMLYWNGTKWAVIPAGSNGDKLEFCNGVPIWGGVASVTTTAASSITHTTASAGGTIVGSCSGINERGIVFATTAAPTTADTKVVDSSGSSPYASSLTGLTAGTTYYVRAYIITDSGTAYGNEISFSTTPYSVGDIGPGGGKVFYDKGSTSNGWRYLEEKNIGTAPWCSNTTSVILPSADQTLGGGEVNTNAAAPSCSSGALRMTYDYTGGGMTDWYLPNNPELSQLYAHQAITDYLGGTGWGSYEYTGSGAGTQAYYINFSNGTFNSYSKTYSLNVIAVRSF